MEQQIFTTGSAAVERSSVAKPTMGTQRFGIASRPRTMKQTVSGLLSCVLREDEQDVSIVRGQHGSAVVRTCEENSDAVYSHDA